MPLLFDSLFYAVEREEPFFFDSESLKTKLKDSPGIPGEGFFFLNVRECDLWSKDTKNVSLLNVFLVSDGPMSDHKSNAFASQLQ